VALPSTKFSTPGLDRGGFLWILTLPFGFAGAKYHDKWQAQIIPCPEFIRGVNGGWVAEEVSFLLRHQSLEGRRRGGQFAKIPLE
jgi:hypothetical protein